MPEVADEKQMKLRYAGACRLCGHALDAGVHDRARGNLNRRGVHFLPPYVAGV